MTFWETTSSESKKRFIVSMLLLLTGPLASAQTPEEQPAQSTVTPPAAQATRQREMTAADLEAFLDGLVPTQLARDDIAGATVAVVKDGKVLFAQGYGFSNVKRRTPVTFETVFRAGSISKLFTWTAVMQLVERGKLSLDKDVNEYLDFQVPHTFGKPVTLRNLMTHTAGFEETVKDLEVRNPGGLIALGQYPKEHQPHQIFSPGAVPAYSN
jgi:CubicO group peptidase (beta-lactamase class C family)